MKKNKWSKGGAIFAWLFYSWSLKLCGPQVSSSCCTSVHGNLLCFLRFPSRRYMLETCLSRPIASFHLGIHCNFHFLSSKPCSSCLCSLEEPTALKILLGITRLFFRLCNSRPDCLQLGTATLEALRLTELSAGLVTLKSEVSNAFLWILMFQPKWKNQTLWNSPKTIAAIVPYVSLWNLSHIFETVSSTGQIVLTLF